MVKISRILPLCPPPSSSGLSRRSGAKTEIRQQLQELRDVGLLLHLGRGKWKLP
ncbi:MAG: hypothetical protein ACLPRE_12920 [Limisphaerales bacterium]